MDKTIAFFDILHEDDIHWFLNNGTERTVEQGAVFINSGDKDVPIYLIIDGFVELYTDGNNRLTVIGPGEMLETMPSLEGSVATVSARAINEVTLLMYQPSLLMSKIKADYGFAYRYYKMIASMMSQRYNAAVTHIKHINENSSAYNVDNNTTWKKISDTIEEFKDLIHKANIEALQNDDHITTDTSDRIVASFRKMLLTMNTEIGEGSPCNPNDKEVFGYKCQREMLPYILLANAAERMYAKPRGYAGDYMTIQNMYNNNPSGKCAVGTIMDRCFLDDPATKAVRNRRHLLIEAINNTITSCGGNLTHITSLACGPAAEVFDIYKELNDPSRLKSTLLDFDIEALAFVSRSIEKMRLTKYIDLVHENLIYLITKKRTLNITRQDLIYSIGLIDYFTDKWVVKLLNLIYDLLKPGGRVILGNFHPRNSIRAFMDHILDWKLIYRTEDDMNRLFAESLFKRECTNIRFEQEQINMFAECIK
ncbi:MAG: class I SAM-dependent methyltransferase family protein [Nitrospirae bacterium]|nr:class I SAM-dependent methyltransferase family protein [Nitrospirota bacterium]